MSRQRFDYPLNAADHAVVVQLLSSCQSVDVGQCSLFPDRADALIWGTNPYGNDGIAANCLGEPAALMALRWVEAQEQDVDECGRDMDGNYAY
jgi:hypothetical protein